MSRWLAPRTLACLVGGLVLLLSISAGYAWTVGYAPDEGSHLQMVEHHATEVGLADWEASRYGAHRGHQYHLYSPVPYLTYLPFHHLQDAVGDAPGATRPDRSIVRLGGLVVAAAQFLVTIGLVRGLFRRVEMIPAVGVALAVNLLPQLRYLHAYVNTDALTILACTVAFWLLLRLLARRALDLGDGVAVGLVLGALALMRYQALAAGMALLFGMVAVLVRQGGRRRPRLRVLGVAVAIPVALAGGFHLHVYHELHNGSLTATADVEALRFSTETGEVFEAPDRTAVARGRIRNLPSTWRGMWLSFPRHVEAPLVLTVPLAAAFAAGLAGLATDGGRLIRRRGQLTVAAAAAAVGMIATVLIFQPSVGLAGRFLLPAAVTVLVGVVAGTASLLARLESDRRAVVVASAAWGVALLGSNLWALRSLL